MPRALSGLRFLTGILFVGIGLSSLMHLGPAYILWYSTVSVGLYAILLFVGLAILVMPYFYNRAKSDEAKRKAVLHFDYALGIAATGVGFMLLLNLVLGSSYWQNLEWIPIVLTIYIVVCSTLFQKSARQMHFSKA